jgi:hypothetical protein
MRQRVGSRRVSFDAQPRRPARSGALVLRRHHERDCARVRALHRPSLVGGLTAEAGKSALRGVVSGNERRDLEQCLERPWLSLHARRDERFSTVRKQDEVAGLQVRRGVLEEPRGRRRRGHEGGRWAPTLDRLSRFREWRCCSERASSSIGFPSLSLCCSRRTFAPGRLRRTSRVQQPTGSSCTSSVRRRSRSSSRVLSAPPCARRSTYWRPGRITRPRFMSCGSASGSSRDVGASRIPLRCPIRCPSLLPATSSDNRKALFPGPFA